MTNEEFDKRMEFILGQQAQFASDIGTLKDVVADIEGVVARLANAKIDLVARVFRRWRAGFSRTGARVLSPISL